MYISSLIFSSSQHLRSKNGLNSLTFMLKFVLRFHYAAFAFLTIYTYFTPFKVDISRRKTVYSNPYVRFVPKLQFVSHNSRTHQLSSVPSLPSLPSRRYETFPIPPSLTLLSRRIIKTPKSPMTVATTEALHRTILVSLDEAGGKLGSSTTRRKRERNLCLWRVEQELQQHGVKKKKKKEELENSVVLR